MNHFSGEKRVSSQSWRKMDKTELPLESVLLLRRSRSPNGFLGVGSITSELPIAPHARVSFRGVDHKVVCEEGGKTTPLETLSGKLLS